MKPPKLHFSFRKIKWLGLAGIILAPLINLNLVSAIELSESELLKFSINDIYFYEPRRNTCVTATNMSFSVNETNLPAATVAYFENMNIENKVNQNKDIYQAAAERTGLPWQALAAIHFREATMGYNKSLLNGQAITGSAYVNVDGQTVASNRLDDAVNAAEHLKSIAKSTYGVNLTTESSLEDWGKAFLAFNRGSMYKVANEPYTKSPYVMNGLSDEYPLGMQWIRADSYYKGQPLNSLAGKTEKRPGALAVMAYLGASSTGATTDGAASQIESVTIIGDLVAEGAEAEITRILNTNGISYHMSIGRNLSFNAGLSVLDQMIADNKLGDILIYALGSNDISPNVNLSDVQAVKSKVEAAGGTHTIIFVTNYDADSPNAYQNNNQNFRAVANGNGTVMVADWEKAVTIANQPYQYLEGSDGLTLTTSGATLFAETILASITNGAAATFQNNVNTCTGGGSAGGVTGGTGVTTATVDNATYAFPIAYATKSNYLNNTSEHPSELSSKKNNWYHHNYPAVDLGIYYKDVTGKDFSPADYPNWPTSSNLASCSSSYGVKHCNSSTGAPVVALTDGTITYYNHYSNGVPAADVQNCAILSLQSSVGDKDRYIYIHLGWEDEYAKKVGQQVKAGEVIGHIGISPCAQNTQAHLHLQTSDKSDKIKTLINELYDALPEDQAALTQREAATTGISSGGLTEAQAQTLARTYLNMQLDGSWQVPAGTKWNCVSFVAYFVQKFTSVGKTSGRTWGNGNATAHKLAADYNLTESRTPQPFSVFSVTKGTVICEGGHKCGHTGIVVAVNGDDIITIEAAFGRSNYTEVKHRKLDYFDNTKFTNTFTYLGSIMNETALSQVVGN